MNVISMNHFSQRGLWRWVGPLYASVCQPGKGPFLLYNAIFAYATAAIAWVFLHMALNCLKSQEIYSRDWKFSLHRKCSTKPVSCFRKHIAGVGFGFGNFGWLVFWCYSDIRGLHWTTWKFHFWQMGADFGTCVIFWCYRRPCFVLQLHITEPDTLTLNFLLETESWICALESLF